MLQAGLTGTAKQFIQRHHRLVVAALLSVATIVTVATAAVALTRFGAPNLVPVALIVVGAALALAPAYFLTRHLWLAVCVAVAPLPGLIWSAAFAGRAPDALLPLLAYGIGFAAAALYTENKLAKLLRTGPGAAPFAPLLLSILGLMGGLALVVFWPPREALSAVAATSAVLASSALLLPLVTSYLRFDEAFVVRANRAREQRARWFERLGQVAVARWGLSFTGITAIMLALGWYGARGSGPGGLIQHIACLVLMAVAGGAIGRGWREGIAFAFAGLAGCLFLVWMDAAMSRYVSGPGAELASFTFYAVVALSGLWRTRCYRLRGEAPGAARGRVLEESGGVVAGVTGAALVLMPALIVTHCAGVAILGIVAAALAGLVLCPAVVTGLEALVPRRRSVEELYGKRQKTVF